jgi:hypothetical protein
MNRGSIAPLAILLVVQAPAPGQTAHECPMASGHRDAVNRRGDEVMGFSHERTTHHFRLYPDGGEIEVAANNPHDISSRHQIRIHLAHIAKMFATGDFDAPVLIHGQVPSGVPTPQAAPECNLLPIRGDAERSPHQNLDREQPSIGSDS